MIRNILAKRACPEPTINHSKCISKLKTHKLYRDGPSQYNQIDLGIYIYI